MSARRFRPVRSPITLLATFVFLAGLCSFGAGRAYAAGRVSPNPNAFTVTEGGATQDIAFQLEEPIIAPTPNPTVVLTFTIDDPSRLSVSPSTLEWDAAEWPQTRTLQVTAIDDGVHDPSNTVVVHVTTTSASEFYSGFTTTLTATIIDADPPPSTTTTATTATTTTTTLAPGTTLAPTTAGVATTTSTTALSPQLAMTGDDNTAPLLVGLLAICVGALLLASSHRRVVALQRADAEAAACERERREWVR